MDLNGAVVSPTGGIHAVRPGSLATACGTNYRRKRFAPGYARNGGWTMMQTSFADLNARRSGRQICLRCLENLELGTGR